GFGCLLIPSRPGGGSYLRPSRRHRWYFASALLTPREGHTASTLLLASTSREAHRLIRGPEQLPLLVARGSTFLGRQTVLGRRREMYVAGRIFWDGQGALANGSGRAREDRTQASGRHVRGSSWSSAAERLDVRAGRISVCGAPPDRRCRRVQHHRFDQACRRRF